MNKFLRVLTAPAWLTKPVADVDENRLTADEVDGNFEYLLVACNNVEGQVSNSFYDANEVCLVPNGLVLTDVWEEVTADSSLPATELFVENVIVETAGLEQTADKAFALAGGLVAVSGMPTNWPTSGSTGYYGLNMVDLSGTVINGRMENYFITNSCVTSEGDFYSCAGQFLLDQFRTLIIEGTNGDTVHTISTNDAVHFFPTACETKWGESNFLVLAGKYDGLPRSGVRLVVYDTALWNIVRSEDVYNWAANLDTHRLQDVAFSLDNSLMAIAGKLFDELDDSRIGDAIVYNTADPQPANWTEAAIINLPRSGTEDYNPVAVQFSADGTRLFVSYNYQSEDFCVVYDTTTWAVSAFDHPLFVTNKSRLLKYSPSKSFVFATYLSSDGGATFFSALLDANTYYPVADNAVTGAGGVFENDLAKTKRGVSFTVTPQRLVDDRLSGVNDIAAVIGGFGTSLLSLFNYVPLADHKWFLRKPYPSLGTYDGQFRSAASGSWPLAPLPLTANQGDRNLLACQSRVLDVGEIEPIGSVCEFVVGVDPTPAFLPLNGATYPSADYPELAALYGDVGGFFDVPTQAHPASELFYAVRGL